jgi:hypothetical protein
MYDALSQVIGSIARATKTLGHPPTVCLVCDEEWEEIAREHVGGPWLGQMKVCGVPLGRLTEFQAARRAVLADMTYRLYGRYR